MPLDRLILKPMILGRFLLLLFKLSYAVSPKRIIEAVHVIDAIGLRKDGNVVEPALSNLRILLRLGKAGSVQDSLKITQAESGNHSNITTDMALEEKVII